MDTSETYIKMCDCEEIQALRSDDKFDDGDWFYDREDDTVNPIISSWWYHRQTPITEVMGGEIQISDNAIWLPRQDQLQEMLATKKIPILSVAWVGYLACLLNSNIGLYATSMEQLWLAFVMKEKYNKIWDGKKWKVESDI